VLVPADAARGGAGVQGLRIRDRRPRPLDRAYRLRRPDVTAARAAAREYRDPHAGVLLSCVGWVERRETHRTAVRPDDGFRLRSTHPAKTTASRTGSCGAPWPCRTSCARPPASR